MRQRKLQTIVWLARLGSFRAVAERLNTTQAAISQRVASIENELGVTLFERNSRYCQLTVKGREILPYAERIVELSNEMLERIADEDVFRGTVRLGVVDTIAHVWLSELIERLQKRCPSATVELTVDTSSALREGVLNGLLDVAFLIGPVQNASMVQTPLCHYQFCWVASPSLGLENRPISLQELALFPIITFPKSSRPYSIVKEAFKGLDNQPLRVNSSGSVATSINLAVGGVGIGLLPDVAIRKELEQGDLHILKTEIGSYRLLYVALHPKDATHPLAPLIVRMAKETAGLTIENEERDEPFAAALL